MAKMDSQKDKAPFQIVHAATAALIFSAVVLVGAWEISIATSKLEQQDFPHTWLDFREGRTTGAIEKQLDKKLPSRTSIIAFSNSLRYLITGGAGDQVRVGKNGWLFLTEELQFDQEGNSSLNARADLIGAAARKLDQLGVKLVIALVPDKARVYSHELKSGHYPAYSEHRYEDVLESLRKRNVAVADLLAPLQLGANRSEVYYRTDTHWNQNGAKIAAETIANLINQLGVVLDKTSFTTTTAQAPVERPGDLIRLMGLENTSNMFRPVPDLETPSVTSSSEDAPSQGLFEDNAISVVLTGTSYSLRGNFYGFLQQALGSKVLNAAKDGGGFLQATTDYLTDEAFQTTKPKVLVWEVPERFMLSKLVGEKDWLAHVGLIKAESPQ